MKTIEVTEQELNQYRLLPDDVLMTEGGDPDKVGRGAIIREPLENCIHQNHIFGLGLMKGIFFQFSLQNTYSIRGRRDISLVVQNKPQELRAST